MPWTNTGGNLKGPKGDKGDAGASGSKWLTGSVVPAAGLGDDGDYYVRNDGFVYGPKTAGAWGSAKFSIKGPEGPEGAVGVAAATAPLVLDAVTKTLSVTIGTTAATVAAGNHTHAQYLTKNANTAMDANRFLSVNEPTNDGHAVNKKYVDDRFATFAGGVTLVGAYNPDTKLITILASQVGPLGLYEVNKPIPTATAATKGHYFIMTTSGPIDTLTKEPVQVDSGDWLVSTGTSWVHVPIADAYRQVFYQDTQPTSFDFQKGNLWIKSSTGELYVNVGDGNVAKVKAEPTAHTHTITDITGLQTALNGKPALGSTAGAALGTAAAGTATTAARSDHVHPLPTAAQVGAAPATHAHPELDEVKIAATAPNDATTEIWVNSANGEVKYKSGGTWQNILTGNGPQGQRGTGWHVGAGAPTTVAGSITGDLYLDTVTGNVYRLD